MAHEVEDCSPKTLETYRFRLGKLHKFLSASGLPVEPGDIKRQHIDAFILHLRSIGYSPFSIQSMYSSLRAWFRWQVEMELIPETAYPMKHMHMPKVPHKVAKPFLPDNALQTILTQCPLNRLRGARDAALVTTLWTTGMRLEECAIIQLEHLEWDRQRIFIDGKGARERYVPFLPAAKKALWRYLEHRTDSYTALWLSEERRPLGYDGVKDAIHNAVKRGGYPDAVDKCHIFRRTWAMRQIKAGIPLKQIQMVGGWENLSTLETYVRAMQSEAALTEQKWV